MKRLVMMLCFMLVAGAAVAQEDGNRDAQNKVVRGPYETNRFFDNFYVGVGGGVNLYRGEYDRHKMSLAPALDVNVGKWFTPSVGARIGYSGIKAAGWTNLADAAYATSSMDGGLYKEKFGISYLHGDVMWNFSNAVSGYKETRTWNFIPFLGAGWVRSYDKNSYDNEWGISAGLLNNIRLCNALDLTLEVRYMIVNERLDHVVGDSKSEGMLSATLGLSYKFNRRGFKRVPAPVVCDYTPYINQIQALQANNSDLTDKNAALNSENEELRNRPASVDSVSTLSVAPVALFFPIGKATLDSKELTNLDFFVKHAILADHTKIFTIIGSADKATGSAKTNQALSEKRMQYVYNLLIQKYGIDATRLTKRAVGDTENQFSEPALNRTVIVQ